MEQSREGFSRFLSEALDRFQRAEAGYLSGADLSPQEARLLEIICRVVDNGQDNRATAIAAARRVTAGTLTTAAKLLEKKGYLTRRRDEADRRVVRLLPTELGRAASERYTAFRKKMMDRALSCLTEDEADAFVRAADKLSRLFRALAESDGGAKMEGTV